MNNVLNQNVNVTKRTSIIVNLCLLQQYKWDTIKFETKLAVVERLALVDRFKKELMYGLYAVSGGSTLLSRYIIVRDIGTIMIFDCSRSMTPQVKLRLSPSVSQHSYQLLNVACISQSI